MSRCEISQQTVSTERSYVDDQRFYWEVTSTPPVSSTIVRNVKRGVARIASDAETSRSVREYRQMAWVVCSREDVGLPPADGVVVRFLVRNRELGRLGLANDLNAEGVTYNLADGFQTHLIDNNIQWPLIRNTILFASFLPERMAIWKNSGVAVAEVGSLKRFYRQSRESAL